MFHLPVLLLPFIPFSITLLIWQFRLNISPNQSAFPYFKIVLNNLSNPVSLRTISVHLIYRILLQLSRWIVLLRPWSKSLLHISLRSIDRQSSRIFVFLHPITSSGMDEVLLDNVSLNTRIDNIENILQLISRGCCRTTPQLMPVRLGTLCQLLHYHQHSFAGVGYTKFPVRTDSASLSISSDTIEKPWSFVPSHNRIPVNTLRLIRVAVILLLRQN